MYQAILETDKPRGKVTKALWKDIRNVSRSGNAITRLIHGSASRRWSDAQDEAVLAAFTAADSLAPSGYRLGSNTERTNVIQAVAVKTKRSPAAVKIRLKMLGVDLSRKKEVAPADIRKFIAAGVAQHIG